MRDLRSRLESKTADIERISASFKTEDGGEMVVSTEQATDYRKAINEATEIKGLIDGMEVEQGLRTWLDAPAGGSSAAGDAATKARMGLATKSLGELWLESPAYKDMRENEWRRFGQTAQFDRGIHSFEGKDVFTAVGGNVSINGVGMAQNLGLMQRQLRPGRIRDLFPSDTTTANLLYGVRETGYINNARVVPERTAADGVSPATGTASDVFGRKPKSKITLTPYTIPVVTIAHIMYVHKNVLEDDLRMRAILDRDMIDGVKMAEDEEILYGPGGERITGLYNTPGVQTYPGVSGQKKSAQIRRAATRAVLAYYQPSGVVCHPFDWEDLELEVDDNGAYTIAVSVAVGGQKRVWRMDLVDTPAMMEGQYVLGAFGLAAKFWDREQVAIQVSTENSDMFERNVITLRAEERGALEVTRPEAMVIGSFA